MQTNSIVPLKIVVSNHSRVAQYLFVHTRGDFFLHLYLFSYNELCCVQWYTRKGAVNQLLLPVPHGFVSLYISLFFQICLFVCFPGVTTHCGCIFTAR